MDKKIIKLGSCVGITFNKAMQILTGFEPNDIVEVKCSKGKLILKKKTEK